MAKPFIYSEKDQGLVAQAKTCLHCDGVVQAHNNIPIQGMWPFVQS
jgi:hypothetical protein